MAICPAMVKRSSTKPSPESASRAKPSASSPASTFLANIGTKARLKAPSAKKRRNMFGSVKAMRNACATGPVPSSAAMTMSRASPRTRDTIVQEPTLRKAGKSRIPTAFIRGASVPELIPAGIGRSPPVYQSRRHGSGRRPR